MFDLMGKKMQTAMLGLLVVMLSLVFIIQFGGPQAQGCHTKGAAFAAEVYSDTVTEGDFYSTEALSGLNRLPLEAARTQRAKERVLDGLIMRALLARQAREIGFDVTEDEVMRRFARDGTVYMSLGDEIAEIRIPDVFDRDGKFDMERAKRFIQFFLRRSVGEFADNQIEETLAKQMRDTVASTVRVSPSEVWEAFVRERDQAKVKYIRFSPAHYRQTLAPTDAEVRAFLAAHQAEVDREYTAQRHRYTGLEKQVRARHILIKAAEDADDATKQAARGRAEQLRRRALAGEDFAALARANSEDEGSAQKGGDLGYSVRGAMVRPFEEAMFALQPGAISDVVETTYGYHVIKVEGVREGDVPEDEAKHEVAEQLYVQERAKELARNAAQEALQALKSGTSMDELDRRLRGRAGAAQEQASTEPGQEPGQPPAEDEHIDPLLPHVEESRPFGRGDSPIPGLDADPLVQAAFGMTPENPLPNEPLAIGEEFVVFRLEDRQRATREAFTADERNRIAAGLLRLKQEEALGLYLSRLRKSADDAGAVRINDSVLIYGDESSETEGRSES